MNNKAYIALGSNIGDRARYLEEALTEIHRSARIEVTNVSSIYETEPVGYTDQAEFLNMVIEINTSLPPSQLLDRLLEIEAESGRIRNERWGPRTLDLDILLYNQENIETERLIIPHPRMTDRAFVLIPLQEVNPAIQIPLSSLTLAKLIDKLQDKEGVQIWKQKNGAEEFGHFES